MIVKGHICRLRGARNILFVNLGNDFHFTSLYFTVYVFFSECMLYFIIF